jgi:hypothetical protein
MNMQVITRPETKPPHGNTSTGMAFVGCEVGGTFDVPPEEYARANSARAHYQKRMWRLYRQEVKFTSSQVKDEYGHVVAHRFRREK